MPDFGLSERESINLNSSGNLLYQKPPTPTSSPPPHRRRTTSNSSTEIVRQSHDFADMSDFEEDLAPNLVKNKENGLDQDANQQIIIESVSSGKCSDGRQQVPIVSDSRLDSRHKCRTVTRTHSLREALVRKFGTSYSCRSHGSEEITKHSQQENSETDTSRSNKPIIGSQVKSQSPIIEKSTEPLGVEKPNSDIKTADNNTQNIPKNPDSPKRISSFIPSEISSDDIGLSSNIDVATSQGSNSNSIPLTSYLPKKFAHPGQAAATANSNDETKAQQNKSQKDANNRSSSVNRSGVLAPDSIFGHGLFKLKKSPSTTELPTSTTSMGIDSSASKIASNQESDTSLKKQFSPNSTLNKQSESNRTSPTQQKLHRANIARHRPGSVRISNVMVLPDKMLKDKANSSECLAGIGVVDSNPPSVKKWSFTKNGSQENLTTSEVSSCIPHIPRPPALKKPATDSDDFSESDGKVSQPNLVLPSRRCPMKSTTAADQKSNNTTTKSAMKISSNTYGRVKELTSLEDSDVDSNIEDENFSDIDCNQNAIADSESIAPPINTPKIRQPSANKLSRHSPPTSISGNITSSPSSSPPKSVTWNLTADVLNIEQDPSELSSSRKHRHQKHQRHHSNEGVNSDRSEGNDHRQRINRTSKQAFVSSNVNEEGNSTTELNQEPKMDQESHVVTAIHESFLENATINLKEQMDALQNFKRGLTPLESYREAISRCLSIQEQTVRKMIKYLKKE